MEPVDTKKIQEDTEGIYEAIAVIAKRARQVNDEIKAALVREMADIIPPATDDGEEKEFNYDQIRISKSFDKVHPVSIAIKEKLEGEVDFRYRDAE